MKLKSYKFLFGIFSFLSDKTNGAPLFVKYKLLLGTLILGIASSQAGNYSKKAIINRTDSIVPIMEEVTCYKPAIRRDTLDKIIVRGGVNDERGEPLIGTNVLIKNTTNGTITDVDGNYIITAGKKDILIFSFVGYDTVEIPVFEMINRNEPIILKETNDIIPIVDIPTITCYMPATTAPIISEALLSGIVKDEQGEVIIGTSVVIKNTTTGVLTDVNGSFTIKAGINEILIFSCIGFDSLEIPVSEMINRTEPVILKVSEIILCYEVVVVSYSSKISEITQLLYNEIQTPPVSPDGGDLDDFREWVEENIIYSDRMRKDKVQGQLILHFAIDKEGKVVDAKILSSLSLETDAEALRILSTSGQWQPGSHYGRNIKTLINIPVYFNANE